MAYTTLSSCYSTFRNISCSHFSCFTWSHIEELSKLFTAASAECTKTYEFLANPVSRGVGNANPQISRCLSLKMTKMSASTVNSWPGSSFNIEKLKIKTLRFFMNTNEFRNFNFNRKKFFLRLELEIILSRIWMNKEI